MNRLGVRDLQPMTNELAESSSAHAENTHSIRDEVPQSSDTRCQANTAELPQYRDLGDCNQRCTHCGA
nr:hypothetical protein [Tanacetum cinerariifolium]